MFTIPTRELFLAAGIRVCCGGASGGADRSGGGGGSSLHSATSIV